MPQTSQHCPLCKSRAKLIRSHIIPQFFYKPLLDDEKRMLLLSSTGEHPVLTRQTGEWEYLLCKKCDNKFSPHEKYVKELFAGNIEVKTSRRGDFLYIQGCNYTHIRLCFLSILWKMSIASRRMFHHVNLGPYENRLAAMLNNENAGNPDEYGFFCTIPLMKNEVLDQLVLQPAWIRIDGQRVYRMVMGCVVVFYRVSRHRVPDAMRALFVQPDGSWFLQVQSVENIPFIHRTLVNMGKNNQNNSM